MEEYILEECPICRGAGLLMHEGGWNVQVECADCSAHTVYVEYEDEDEKAAGWAEACDSEVARLRLVSPTDEAFVEAGYWCEGADRPLAFRDDALAIILAGRLGRAVQGDAGSASRPVPAVHEEGRRRPWRRGRPPGRDSVPWQCS